MRQAAAAIAEARPSRSQAPAGAASTTATVRLGRAARIDDGDRQADIAGAGDQHVEPARRVAGVLAGRSVSAMMLILSCRSPRSIACSIASAAA